MQFVRLVNVDNRPYDFHQNNRKRILQPGEEAMVPWDVATSLFGDPFTSDTQTDMARTRAWTQSSSIHGYVVGGMTDEEWEVIRPKVEVWDMETQQRVFMVMEDPQGYKLNGAAPMSNGAQNSSFLEARIEALTKMVETLVGQKLATDVTTPPTGQAPVTSEDAADPTLATGFDLGIMPVVATPGPPPGPQPGIPPQSPTEDAPTPPHVPSVGGALPIDLSPDVITQLQVTEDNPQSVPTGQSRLAPRVVTSQ